MLQLLPKRNKSPPKIYSNAPILPNDIPLHTTSLQSPLPPAQQHSVAEREGDARLRRAAVGAEKRGLWGK